MVPKVRRGVGHPSSRARRTHAAIFTGKRDEQLVGASDAAKAGEAVAQQAGADISGLRIEDVPHSHAAAARGVELIRGGEGALLIRVAPKDQASYLGVDIHAPQ